MAKKSHWVFKLLSQPKKETRKGKKGKRKRKREKVRKERGKGKEKRKGKTKEKKETGEKPSGTQQRRIDENGHEFVMSSVVHCVDKVYSVA